MPQSIHAQTFHVLNYFELYLSHDNTVFSNESTQRFYFQLIQPSLTEGVVETPPPLFYDCNGVLMNSEVPQAGVPEGEIVQGEAMDIEDDDKPDK